MSGDHGWGCRALSAGIIPVRIQTPSRWNRIGGSNLILRILDMIWSFLCWKSWIVGIWYACNMYITIKNASSGFRIGLGWRYMIYGYIMIYPYPFINTMAWKKHGEGFIRTWWPCRVKWWSQDEDQDDIKDVLKSGLGDLFHQQLDICGRVQTSMKWISINH